MRWMTSRAGCRPARAIIRRNLAVSLDVLGLQLVTSVFGLGQPGLLADRRSARRLLQRPQHRWCFLALFLGKPLLGAAA